MMKEINHNQFEPWSKEQLIDWLRLAISNNEAALENMKEGGCKDKELIIACLFEFNAHSKILMVLTGDTLIQSNKDRINNLFTF